MKKDFLLLFLAFSVFTFAQIKGTVTDDKGVPLASVSILVENTYNGTSSNEKGNYELNVKTTGTHRLIFQCLGFKTQKITVVAQSFPLVQNVKLIEENLSLSEVVINTKENPANGVIRHAIASKKDNSEKTARYKADFYSRGIFRIKDVPKKIFGQETDPEHDLDSTGSGIIYLSETVSKIIFEKPDNLKERITASKVSGNNNGFSYNTARMSKFDFYDNTIKLGMNLISPIADNAFGYYKFKLQGTFQDENNQMINKIKVIAKRDSEPVFEGYIYIVEDSWAIYAVDLVIKGYRIHNEIMDSMNLKQNFSYNTTNHIWAKNTQSLDFTAGIFGIKFNGKFTYIYSNYEFPSVFAKKTFTNEIVSFEENSNKKDSVFWNKNRPIPLTVEESRDYIKKDSIFIKRNSKTYLDSIDKKENKFKILDPLTGYTYKNSTKKYSIHYDGLTNIASSSFNTVQGWNLDSGISYNEWNDEGNGKSTFVNTKFNYGFSDQRLRIVGNFNHRFNNQNYAYINIAGGSKVNQFNAEEPISKIANTVSTLFFRDNYMKLYNKEFAEFQYGQDVGNGFNLNGRIEYQQRKALVNTTDQNYIKSDKTYTSNNPLLAESDLPAFETHHLTKFTLGARINFGNKYMTRPDGKINIRNDKYPTILLSYENAVAGSDKNYDYQLVKASIYYVLSTGNKGQFSMNFKAGKFFHGENISFIDFKHFNGNQTHYSENSRLNAFNLLPYYTNSTNDAYLENHIEYTDNGFIINKIPLLNLLKTNLVLGYNGLAVPNTVPYTELSIGLNNLGFGKFKMFRIDYVRAYQFGYQGDGFMFGFKF